MAPAQSGLPLPRVLFACVLSSLLVAALAGCGAGRQAAPPSEPQTATRPGALQHCEGYTQEQLLRLDMPLRLSWLSEEIEQCEKSAGQKAADYVVRGSLYVEQPGDGPTQAIEDFGAAIALQPDYSEAYAARSAAYIKLGRYQEALADSDRVISLAPSADAYVVRASIHKGLGDDEAALDDYSEAIALAPELANSYSLRGLLYAKFGRTDEAMADFLQAMELDPIRAAQWQEILTQLGYYDGPLDGNFDQASEAALRVWIDDGTPGLVHSGATVTGQ